MVRKKSIIKITKRNVLKTRDSLVKLETYDTGFNPFNLLSSIIPAGILITVGLIVGVWLRYGIFSDRTLGTTVTTAVTPQFVDTNANAANASSDGWTIALWVFGSILFLVITGVILTLCIVYEDEIKAFKEKYNPFYIKDGHIHIRRK
jgi:hypothetical protein